MASEIKSKYQLYEEIKKLCEHVYHTNAPVPNDWKLIHKHSNFTTGFYGEIFQKGPYTVVTYKGTNDLQDWIFNNVKMGQKQEPSQVNDAYLLYTIARGKNSLAEIIVAGHSLGGSLAQIVSAKANVEAVTFNAYGTGDILKNLGLDKRKYHINNFGIENDKTFRMNLDKQPGKTYIVNTNQLTEKEFKNIITEAYRKTYPISNHFTEDMPPLETSKEISSVSQIPYTLARKRKVYKNLDSQSITDYKQHLEPIHEKIERAKKEWERQERERIIQEFERKTNNFINDMRSFCSQSGKNIKMTIQTAAGRIEHIQSGYIPPQAKIINRQQFQLKGTTQDIIRQIKNHIK